MYVSKNSQQWFYSEKTNNIITNLILKLTLKKEKVVLVCTIASKIYVTPKGVRLSEKLQHSVMKFDRSNKFDLRYYGQVNSLRVTFEGNIYFAGDCTIDSMFTGQWSISIYL